MGFWSYFEYIHTDTSDNITFAITGGGNIPASIRAIYNV